MSVKGGVISVSVFRTSPTMLLSGFPKNLSSFIYTSFFFLVGLLSSIGVSHCMHASISFVDRLLDPGVGAFTVGDAMDLAEVLTADASQNEALIIAAYST
jgi:hypothetical protein